MSLKWSLSKCLLDILYPPSCIGCRVLLENHAPFCKDCLEQFTLLRVEGHCMKCFAEMPNTQGTCKSCRQIAHPFRKLATCFDSFGPGKQLLQVFLQEKSPKLAKDLAATIVVQIHELSFLPIDTLVLLPMGLQNPFKLVAKEIAHLLEIPLLPILKREKGFNEKFSVKKKCNIFDKKVLLLHTEMQDRKQMRAAGWAIKAALPKIIYGMTFCATLHS